MDIESKPLAAFGEPYIDGMKRRRTRHIMQSVGKIWALPVIIQRQRDLFLIPGDDIWQPKNPCQCRINRISGPAVRRSQHPFEF